MSIEQQLREQLSQELQKHTAALSGAFQALRAFQKEVEREQNEVMALEAKLHLFDQTFGTAPKVLTPLVEDVQPIVAAPSPEPMPVPAEVVISSPVSAPPPPVQEAVPPVAAKPPVAKKTVTKEYLRDKINNSRAAIGRREVAEGKRPKIKDAMIEAMGERTMNAIMIYNYLKSKEWLPNADDPRAYIAYLLSSLRDTFERVEGRGRGFYRVRRATTPDSPHVNGATNLSETDAILRDAGVLPAN